MDWALSPLRSITKDHHSSPLPRVSWNSWNSRLPANRSSLPISNSFWNSSFRAMETLPWRKPCFSFARSPLISSPSPSIRFSNLPRCSLNGNLFLLPLTLTRRPSQFDPKFQFAALKHTIPRRSTVVWSSQGGAAAYPLSGIRLAFRFFLFLIFTDRSIH